MKKFTILLFLILFIGSSSFTSNLLVDDYKYVKEVNGVRIYYVIKSYSYKPGKTAKKLIIKLKNSTASSKTITFKLSWMGENNTPIGKEIIQCLKSNEENLKNEVLTEYKEIKDIKVEKDKTTEGGC